MGDNVEHTAEQMIKIVRGGTAYACVTLRGSLDHDATQRLRTQLGAVLDTGARYVTVDLSDVSYCDENVLDLLGWAERRASSQQGWLALTGGHKRIRLVVR
jgi:anti-anti-sigma regulatory factor